MENQMTQTMASAEEYRALKKIERIIVLSLLALAVVVIVAVISIVAVSRARRRLASYNNLIAELEVQEQSLKSDVDYMENGNYLEEHARDYFGMIQDGETYYVFD